MWTRSTPATCSSVISSTPVRLVCRIRFELNSFSRFAFRRAETNVPHLRMFEHGFLEMVISNSYTFSFLVQNSVLCAFEMCNKQYMSI